MRKETIGDATLYLGDCLEILPTLEKVDLVFADPPFNIGLKYGVSFKDKNENYEDWVAQWVNHCFNLLHDTGSFYLMTLSKHLEWKMPLMATQGNFVNLIIWRNVSANHSKRTFWGEYQPILFYAKSDRYIFHVGAQIDKNIHQRWFDFKTGSKGQMKDRWDDIPFVYAGSVIHEEAVLEKGTNKKAHPAQMPIALPQRAIAFSSNENSIALDPFMGSGTTGVAALNLGRKFIGIEIEESYFDIACKRIEDAHRQPSLFDRKETFKQENLFE